MNITSSYKDLCEEIEMWKDRVKAYEAEIKALKKLAKFDGPAGMSGIDYSSTKVQGTNQMGFEEALERIWKLEKHIYLHQEAIKNMEKYKERIEGRIDKLEGIDKKVIYMRDIKGMSLKEIAEKLGYSYDYIKEVSARNKRTHFYPTDKE